jgi:flagellar hook-associated protein FlgK
MISSFQPLNTITSGLVLQQLQQEVNANNLSQTYLDPQGYLMNSLEQVNSSNNSSISFTGSNGLLSVGTGSSAESITRLRSSFLDAQIQQQSNVVGYNEILSNSSASGVMDQINSIINPATVSPTPSPTLNYYLGQFGAAWGTLASSPTNIADQNAVVAAGVAFASAANSQYNQLQALQLNMNSQVSSTVGQINGLLQQLASINKQLLQNPNSNQNSLLDARDYALDKLSRLTNYQVTYGTDGVATLWLNDVSLVSGSNAAVLQTFTESLNNAQLTGITINNNGNTFSYANKTGTVVTPVDLTSLITGGNLAGELYARNTVLESYKASVDQIATSVLNATNNIYESGYVAGMGTASTGVAFFTGAGATDIQVNGALTTAAASSPATSYLATQYTASTVTAATASTFNLASFLQNLPNIYSSNYVASSKTINVSSPPAPYTPIDPTSSIVSQMANFQTHPLGGSFTVNGVAVTYTTGAANDTINSILNQINASSSTSGVYAVFNYTNQEFYIYGNTTINIVDGVGDNFASWSNGLNTLSSSIVMNNSTNPNIDYASALNATVPSAFDVGPNSQAFLVTPSATGSFSITLNGVTHLFNWNNTQTLTQIKNAIHLVFPTITIAPSVSNQNILVFQTPFTSGPLTITDSSGNFTTFTGLNSNSTMANLASGILNNSTNQESTFKTAFSTSSASLTQLNNAQANIAAVSTGSTVPGIPIATIQEQAQQSLITYNAMLQVMEVINQMLDALVGISSTSNSSGIFATRNS